MPPFQIAESTTEWINVFVWDNVLDEVVTWGIPTDVLKQDDVLVAADKVMAESISKTDPDYMVISHRDQPIVGVLRAIGSVSYGPMGVYVPLSPEYELLAFDLAKRDYEAALKNGSLGI